MHNIDSNVDFQTLCGTQSGFGLLLHSLPGLHYRWCAFGLKQVWHNMARVRGGSAQQTPAPPAGRIASCVTCINTCRLRIGISNIFVYLFVSIILFQHALSLDLKSDNHRNYNQCEKCKMVVDSFKEVSVYLAVLTLF